MGFVRIAEYNNWIIDYNDDINMYRVSYFENNHFQDECLFFAYDNNKKYEYIENEV